MKTLVTGGAGFIGSHIVDALLKKRHSVVVVDNFTQVEKNLSDAKKIAQEMNVELSIVKADVSAEKTWKELPVVDAIFHIAAQTSVTASVLESDRDFSWNILAAKYLVEYIKKIKLTFSFTQTQQARFTVFQKLFPQTKRSPFIRFAPMVPQNLF